MLHRSRALVALFPLFALAACDDDNDLTGVGANRATVQFVNATDAAVDVNNGGTIASDNRNLGFGGSSSCMNVNTTGAAGTMLEFRTAGTTTALSGFAQNFASGGNYTVVAYPGFTGNTNFVTVDNGTFVAASGQAGIRVVNAVPNLTNLVLRVGTAVIGSTTGTAYGSASAYTSVAAGNHTFTLASGNTTVATTSVMNLAAGRNYTLVVAPAATGSTALRTFLVGAC